jgi:pyridine nucleotide-disulfide oxidoreductase family protein
MASRLMGMRRLLLLGGGHAHLQVLDALARAPIGGVQALLVTPVARQMYSGMVPGLLAGHYEAQACAIPLVPLAAAAGVRLLEGRAVALDAAARRVTLADGKQLDYHLLSIDTGSEMDRGAVPGAAEHGLFVRPIESFEQQVDDLFERAARCARQVCVIGGGAAGFELAMALAHRLRRVGDGCSRVALISGEALLAGLAPRVQRRARRALAAQGILLHQQACVAVGANHLRLADGTRLACDEPVLAIGASAPLWLAGSGLALDAQGFVATEPTLQSRSHAEVFAAGDVATRCDAPRPKSGVYAVRAGPPLVANLRRWLEGEALLPHTPQVRTLVLLSCGERRAIASWGGWSAEGRWVWWWKDRIDRAFVARYTRFSATA